MKRVSVASTNINSIGYDAERQILEIEFRNGGVYQYFGVPKKTHQDILISGALSRYFSENIKNQYDYIKLSDDPYRESEFTVYLSKLIQANDQFSKVSLEPSFKDEQDSTLRPDIVCEYQNKTLIIQTKKVAPLIDSRVSDYISQVKKYSIVDADAQLVVAFPEELQKQYESDFKKENILIWDISKLASIFSDQLEVIRETPLYPIIFNAGVKKSADSKSKVFIAELESIKPGKADWSRYQKLVRNCMEYLFSPPLQGPIYEKSDTPKINRRDIIFPNYAENGFWKFLRDNYLAYYIVLDAKNLTKHIEKKDILQVSNYLKNCGTGLFGIIVSRNKPHSNAVLTQREHWIMDNKLIVFLQDEDLIQMLTMKDGSGKPEDVIRQKIEDFRLSI